MDLRAPALLATGLGVAAGAGGGAAVAVAPARPVLLLTALAGYGLLLAVAAVSHDPRRAAVLAIAAVAATFSWSGVPVVSGLSLAEVAPLACLPFAVVGTTRTSEPRTPLQTAVLAAPPLVTLGGILAGTTHGASLAPVVTFALAAVTLVTTMYLLRPDRRELDVLLLGLIAGIVLSTLVGLVLLREGSGRATGLTIHPNQYSMAAVMAVPLTWHLVRDGFLGRLTGVLGVLVLLAGILESGSRSGLLALAVVLFVWGYRELGFFVTGSVAVVFAAIVATAGSLLPGADAPAVRRLTDPTATEQSDQGRLELFESELRAILDGNYILGTGFVEERLPHNILLLLWGGFGLLGLVLFLWLLSVVVGPALRRNSSPVAAFLGLGSLGFAAAVSFNNLVGASFFWFVAAISCFRVGAAPPAVQGGPEAGSAEHARHLLDLTPHARARGGMPSSALRQSERL
ncbi:MAG TPA: hypothetical protein VHG70_06220 [Nocardioidaceae bacterium]|nr:hypothetical protein [Nocardioidaceae bacterium]